MTDMTCYSEIGWFWRVWTGTHSRMHIILNNELISWFILFQLTASLTKKNTFVGTPVSPIVILLGVGKAVGAYDFGDTEHRHVWRRFMIFLLTFSSFTMIVLDGTWSDQTIRLWLQGEQGYWLLLDIYWLWMVYLYRLIFGPLVSQLSNWPKENHLMLTCIQWKFFSLYPRINHPNWLAITNKHFGTLLMHACRLIQSRCVKRNVSHKVVLEY